MKADLYVFVCYLNNISFSVLLLFSPDRLLVSLCFFFFNVILSGQKTKRINGCSPIGKRAEVKRMTQNWGLRITAILILCTEGMIDLGLYQGNVNGATFKDFVDEKLCPNLLPFNGINSRSVLIMGTRESLAILGF